MDVLFFLYSGCDGTVDAEDWILRIAFLLFIDFCNLVLYWMTADKVYNVAA